MTHDEAVAKHRDAWKVAKDAAIKAGTALNEARGKIHRARTDRGRARAVKVANDLSRVYEVACRAVDDIEVAMVVDGAVL